MRHPRYQSSDDIVNLDRGLCWGYNHLKPIRSMERLEFEKVYWTFEAKAIYTNWIKECGEWNRFILQNRDRY